MNLGLWPNQYVFLNRLPALFEQAKALEGLGIKPDFAIYELSGVEHVKEHFLPHVSKPYFLGSAQGVHNTTPPRFDLTEISAEFYQDDDIVWQFVPGGRNWLSLAVFGIMLGCDIIRVGMEDNVFLYPDQDTKISSFSEVVKKIATIARGLGREIATPKEARERLGLRQVT
jgi:3-keto-5-aminohexanoate cleavage enzyme